MTAGSDVVVGEEVAFAYGGGRLPSDRFLQDYGFLDDEVGKMCVPCACARVVVLCVCLACLWMPPSPPLTITRPHEPTIPTNQPPNAGGEPAVGPAGAGGGARGGAVHAGGHRGFSGGVYGGGEWGWKWGGAGGDGARVRPADARGGRGGVEGAGPGGLIGLDWMAVMGW